MEKATLDERETVFTIEATDRNTVRVFTNDSVWINKMEKLGIAHYDEDSYGRFYRVSMDEFNLRFRKKRKMTEEQRKKLATRLHRRSQNSHPAGENSG